MENKTLAAATTPKLVDISRLVGGAPQIELYLLQTVMIMSMLMRNLLVPILFNGRRFVGSKKLYWSKFCIDYLFVVVPAILAMTVLGQYLDLFALILFLVDVILLLFLTIEYLISGQPFPLTAILNTKVDESFLPTAFLTIFRGSMLVQIGVAILAVDFNVFPSKFAKTIHYGHSIMDIGVAACIIADGMSSTLKRFRKKREPRINSTWSFLLSGRVILPVLGFIRIFFLWAFNYSHSVMEYGEHWNFFFTMAVIAIVCRLLPRNYPVTIALTFTVLHFFLLAEGREVWILVGENPRSNLLLANIEGISSLTGYLAMYYAAAAIGVFVSNTTDDIKSWLWLTVHFFLISFVFFGAQKGTELFGFLPSRRVCNVTFVLSQLSMLIFSTGVLLVVQMVIWILWASHAPRFSQYDAPYEAVRPDLQDTINRYGLLHFLGCNILTGLVNMSIYTSSVDDLGAVGILLVYQAIMAALCQYLRGRGQKKSGVLV